MGDPVADRLEAPEPCERGWVEHGGVAGIPDQAQVGRGGGVERSAGLGARGDVALVLVLEGEGHPGVACARRRTTQRAAELRECGTRVGFAPVRERTHDRRGHDHRGLERALVHALLHERVVAPVALQER